MTMLLFIWFIFQNINFNNNSIPVISGQAFINQTNLTSLNLNNNDITSYPYLESCDHIMTFLGLSGNNLRDIQIDYFSRFPQLEVLTLDRNGISRLTTYEMRGLFNLVVFSIAGNDISSIACDTFADNPKLNVLNLEGNQLSSLPCIKSTPETWSLAELNLKGNQLRGGHNASVAAHLKNVRILNLADNDLQDLANFLTEMPSLKLLWLNGNRHLSFDPADIANSGDLTWVKFDDSSITVAPLFGTAKNKLDYLDFGINRISCIDIDHISNMTNMRALNFTRNDLKLFPDIGCLTQSPISSEQDINFPKLMEIILTFNQISVFPLLPGMPFRSTIRLQYNELRQFPPERMALLTKVGILQMQYNNVNAFPDFSQVPSSHMTDLDLSYNNISNIRHYQCSGKSYRSIGFSYIPSSTTQLYQRSTRHDFCS